MSKHERPHYQRMRFTQDRNGKRGAARCGRGMRHDLRGPVLTPTGDLIQTILALDLDTHRSHEDFRQGHVLDVEPLLRVLKERLPICFENLSNAVQTPGGGFHLLFSVSSFILNHKTESLQRRFVQVQSELTEWLADLGYGADPSHHGLGKTYASPENIERLLYANKEAARTVQRDRRADLRRMHEEIQASLAASALYPKHRGVERRLAPLALRLLDEGSLDCTVDEVAKATGIGVVTLRKMMSHYHTALTLPWLSVEPLAEVGHYTLSLDYGCAELQTILARAKRLASLPRGKGRKTSGGGGYGLEALVAPCFVSDGERNHAITNYALVLKWAGVDQEATLARLAALSEGFPCATGARHTDPRFLARVVKSIYRRHVDLADTNDASNLPRWLISDANETGKGSISRSDSTYRADVLEGPFAVKAQDVPSPLVVAPVKPEPHRPARRLVRVFDYGAEAVVQCGASRSRIPGGTRAQIRSWLKNNLGGKIAIHWHRSPEQARACVEAALKWHDAGFAVIPLTGKSVPASWSKGHPLKGLEREAIPFALNGGNRNFGILTGRVNGLIVVDANDARSVEWMRKTVYEPTLEVRTVRGVHFYFRATGKEEPCEHFVHRPKRGVKINVWGDGGFVTGPGSVHESGAAYEPSGFIEKIEYFPFTFTTDVEKDMEQEKEI